MSWRAAYEIFEEQTGLPLFVQPWYLDLVAPRTWRAATVTEHDRVTGVLPYLVERKGLLRYSGMPPFAKYMGPYLDKSVDTLSRQHSLLGRLADTLPQMAYFQQNFHPDLTNWMPFYWRGYRQTTRYTYRLHLDGTDAWRKNINRNMRRTIIRADSQLEVTHQGQAADLYRMVQASFRRQQLTVPFTASAMTSYVNALVAQGTGRFFFARNGTGKIVAAAMLLWDAGTAYYHLAGEGAAGRESGASILLTAKAIAYADQIVGCGQFDFEGSMLEGVERIRRQFGAAQHPYFCVWKTRGWGTALRWWRSR